MSSQRLLQLIRARKANAPRRRLRRPPKWLTPDPIERAYYRYLNSLIRDAEELIDKLLVARLEDIARAAEVLRPDSARADAEWSDKITQALIATRAGMADRTEKSVLRNRANELAKDVSDFNLAQLKKITKAVIGVDVFIAQPWLEGQIESFAAENVDLIESIVNQPLSEIERLAQRGVRQGKRNEEIRKEIQQRFKVSRSRAALIARDQVSKLNGQLTELRQRELGVGEYIWRTSKDERVRDSHRRKEGKRFNWANPPADTGHPGQDYQCRCTAEPVFPEP